MSPADIHTVVRLSFIAVCALVSVLVCRSLTLAYIADYGLPKRKGVNGRSNLDGKVLRREIMFAILWVLSLLGMMDRVLKGEDTPITNASVLVTAFCLVFGVTYLDLWWAARRERLNYREQRGGGSGTRIGP